MPDLASVSEADARRLAAAGASCLRVAVLAHVLVLGALLVVPFALRSEVFVLRLFNQVFLNVTILLGFLVVLGFAKQFSLAQVAFYGIGAYTTAALTARLGMGFLPALALGGLMAGMAGGLLAIPAARFQGPWLSLVTLAFAEIIRIMMVRAKPVTGGAGGFYNIPRPTIAGVEVTQEIHYYFLFLALVGAVYLVTLRLRHSPYGRIWLAIGDNPDIAASMGVNVFAHQVLIFVAGAVIAGLAGGAFAGYATFISPEGFGLAHTVQFLTMLVVGGLESIVGGVLSVVFFTLSSNELMKYHPWDLIIDGLIIVLFMNCLPSGIGGILTSVRQRVRPWRRRAER
jgi:branched-chain amino acid transport system permease protein